ncbi:prepilin-type N-terminal cleavage/methylation domain-containing protein [bacterium]|nr:prepilin-type N-terminal cleavage/methylation domain-containing protein [candidate division CSSED10-310 bacterium]
MQQTTDNSAGFTLVETLITLVIAALATVSLGMLSAGTAQIQREARALTSASAWGDCLLEQIVLHGDLTHPDVLQTIHRIRQTGWTLSLRSDPEQRVPDAVRITITIDHPDLRAPVRLTRLQIGQLPRAWPEAPVPS